VLATDISERTALEEQLRQSQKMEAIGRLAGGIAHDFNNLLTVILGYASAAQKKLDAKSPVHRLLSEIQGSAEYAAALTGQLLAFSRKQLVEHRMLDLNQAVRGMKEILNRLLGEDIVLALKISTEPCPVKADLGQLSQVIMNLAVNARDAMPKGGCLTIETKTMLRKSEDMGKWKVRPPGRYCLLIVSDNGAGMDADIQSHIFEPFFTTKEVGKGTGLGLSTVYGIVAQHDGWIDVDSEPGRGAAFRIYFPASEGILQEKAPAGGEPRGQASGTILLVEDQAALRLMGEALLMEAGYRVLSAASGRAALELAEKYAGPIDMLVTDVVMPEMNGPELAGHLSRTRPGLMVLYVSGYTDHAMLQGGGIESGTAFLQKPFLLDALRTKVDELLRARNISKG
jgi:nitrogen-specific signal transduction histidine kinase/CheY-like chemotaxis protein